MSAVSFCGFTPLNDQILVRRIDGPATHLPKYRRDLILIPEQCRKKSPWAVVLAAGKKVADEIVGGLRTGDMVLMQSWGGQDVKVEGHELISLRPEHILAVVED